MGAPPVFAARPQQVTVTSKVTVTCAAAGYGPLLIVNGKYNR